MLRISTLCLLLVVFLPIFLFVGYFFLYYHRTQCRGTVFYAARIARILNVFLTLLFLTLFLIK